MISKPPKFHIFLNLLSTLPQTPLLPASLLLHLHLHHLHLPPYPLILDRQPINFILLLRDFPFLTNSPTPHYYFTGLYPTKPIFSHHYTSCSTYSYWHYYRTSIRSQPTTINCLPKKN